MSYRYGGIFSPYVPIQEPFRVQQDHFVDCVLSGRRPQTDGDSGLAVVRILEAAARSLHRGTAVWLRDGLVDVENMDPVSSTVRQDLARSQA